MRFAVRRPRGMLNGLVDLFWLYEGYGGAHPKERLLPDGSVELVVNLSEDEVRVWDRRDLTRFQRLDGAVLVGPHSEYFVIDTAGQQNVLGVHFRPGGAFPFFGLPADELHGQHVSLRELWGGFARQLREQLLAARTPEARLDLAEMALLRQMRTPSPHPAVRYALGEFQGPRRVRDVCAATGLSARRFIELFRREVGMAPKQYCRVRRFQRVVQSAGMAAVDWSAVALEAGYCDQSHLIHEFREISGLSPSAWAGLRTGHRNHVPIPG